MHVGSMRYHCELEVYILYIIYLCKKTAVNNNMLEVAFATEKNKVWWLYVFLILVRIHLVK